MQWTKDRQIFQSDQIRHLCSLTFTAHTLTSFVDSEWMLRKLTNILLVSGNSNNRCSYQHRIVLEQEKSFERSMNMDWSIGDPINPLLSKSFWINVWLSNMIARAKEWYRGEEVELWKTGHQRGKSWWNVLCKWSPLEIVKP